QYADQAATGANDFLEVVDRFDFFLKVDVLGLQTRLLALQQDPLRDVDEHRAGVGSAPIRFRPPLNEDWPTVILAAQLEYHAAGVGTACDGFDRVLETALCIRRIRNEGSAVREGNFFRLDAQDAQRGAVCADEVSVDALVHVGDRRLFEQVAEPIL